MSAPASVHQDAVAAIDDAVALLRAMVQRRRERQTAADSDTADHRRPLGAGARPMQHEDRTYAGKQDGAAIEEDDRRERITTTDD